MFLLPIGAGILQTNLYTSEGEVRCGRLDFGNCLTLEESLNSSEVYLWITESIKIDTDLCGELKVLPFLTDTPYELNCLVEKCI